MMNILEKLVIAICNYGEWGAGLLSNHGVYEEEVPYEIQSVLSKK